QEKYCDATIVCQGKYFPVHRVILSTCSDYFEEIFEKMQCQHPYIVFKDIVPAEMELLLNYMYQGEVNVVQELLPSLIKAAEALHIKGLAVPDDLPSSKEPSGKKRSSNSSEAPQPKRRAEDNRRRRAVLESSDTSHNEANQSATHTNINMEKNCHENTSNFNSLGHEVHDNRVYIFLFLSLYSHYK
ncbi:UNVERIFIED_CONTAM: hypothetical protein GTU68_008674, partial [Idotea baltica]|nr:hypothetical protein [Idotea baltica]